MEESFNDLVLPKEIKESVLDLARSTCQARDDKDTSFRHVIFHGPDGVGKSMAAKKLAQVVGIDYAHVCGRDIQTSGEKAVRQIQTLFSWARLSSDGILLFIDDAEAFLRSIESSPMNDVYTRENNNALCTFLHNMKGLRKNIIFVLATNRVKDLDAQVLDLCEERIFIPLPDARSRKSMLLFYFDTCVQKIIKHKNSTFSVKSKLIQLITRQDPLVLSIEDNIMEGEQLEEAVAATRGFSGNDIRDLMLAMQTVVQVSENGRLAKSTAWKVIEDRVKRHWLEQTTWCRYCHTHCNCNGFGDSNTKGYLDGDVIDLQDITFV